MKKSTPAVEAERLAASILADKCSAEPAPVLYI
jgi:hypothetical protein